MSHRPHAQSGSIAQDGSAHCRWGSIGHGADKGQTVHEANEIVGAGCIGCRSQPSEPGLLDGWIDRRRASRLSSWSANPSRRQLRPVVRAMARPARPIFSSAPSGNKRAPRPRNAFTIAVTIGSPLSVARPHRLQPSEPHADRRVSRSGRPGIAPDGGCDRNGS